MMQLQFLYNRTLALVTDTVLFFYVVYLCVEQRLKIVVPFLLWLVMSIMFFLIRAPTRTESQLTREFLRVGAISDSNMTSNPNFVLENRKAGGSRRFLFSNKGRDLAQSKRDSTPPK